MKQYQKAQMIAKNLPTGSYAAGCPTGTRTGVKYQTRVDDGTPNGKICNGAAYSCSSCEIAS